MTAGTARQTERKHHVVIVGGGFAGLGCALRLADDDRVRVTLIDRRNYHQFQPLLYQVATSQLAPSDTAQSLRAVFAGSQSVRVKLAEISSVDLPARTVRTGDGDQWAGDALVLAVGSQPNFFGTPGAPEHSFPLYSLDDATRLRSRILGIFEQVDRDPSLVDRGALNFLVVGGGPTGVEVAGAIADMLKVTVPAEYRDIDPGSARVHLVDLGDALLKPFSDRAHEYVARVLRKKGIELHLRTGVREIAGGHALLTDGSVIFTRCVIWGGGVTAAELTAHCGLGRGGRVDVAPDLTVSGHPGVYATGDAANIADRDGAPLPQLGSVALQSGRWAADNILAELAAKPTRAFAYRDKGIMAMIGRGAAIAEVGEARRELRGELARMAWLGVHASLMVGARAKIEAIINWSWDGFTKTGGPHVLDRAEAAEIDWGQEPAMPASAQARLAASGLGVA